MSLLTITPPGLPVNAVTFHTADWPTVVAPDDVEVASLPRPGNEWAVWNAPRPLSGNRTWTGQFRHGIFYAAIRLDDTYYDAVALANSRNDAYPVVLVDDAHILAAVTWYAEQNGYTLQAALDAGIGINDLADELGLPQMKEEPS